MSLVIETDKRRQEKMKKKKPSPAAKDKQRNQAFCSKGPEKPNM
jgi:hypothetical protein